MPAWPAQGDRGLVRALGRDRARGAGRSARSRGADRAAAPAGCRWWSARAAPAARGAGGVGDRLDSAPPDAGADAQRVDGDELGDRAARGRRWPGRRAPRRRARQGRADRRGGSRRAAADDRVGAPAPAQHRGRPGALVPRQRAPVRSACSESSSRRLPTGPRCRAACPSRARAGRPPRGSPPARAARRARDGERGVRLARRRERLLDADVQLLLAAGEPHAAACAQPLRACGPRRGPAGRRRTRRAASSQPGGAASCTWSMPRITRSA